MANDEARQRIEILKIATLDENIRMLKTQRNELALISQLPSEIMGMIFGFAVEDGGPAHADLPTWFNFSYVSQLWRGIALDTPRLWGILSFRSRKWTTAMLERSKMTPLTIRVVAKQPDNVDSHTPRPGDRLSLIGSGRLLKDVLLNYTPRIQELDLTSGPPFHITATLEDMPAHAPLLHTLRLSSDRYLNGDEDAWFFIQVPVSLLDGKGAPNLRNLKLQSVNIDWKTISFRGLVNLKIAHCCVLPSHAEFVDALQQMTTLESLDLDTIPSGFEIAAASVHKISLPKLQILRFPSTFINVVNVLTLVSVPMITTLEIHCTSSPEDERQALHFSYALAALISFTQYTELLVWGDPDGSLTLIARSTPCTNSDNSYRLSISIDSEGSGTFTSDMLLLQVLPGISLSHLKKLYLSDPGFGAATLMKAFGTLPRLCHVGVEGSCLKAFVKAFKYKKENFNSSLPAFLRVSFPTLTSLTVRQGVFSRHFEDGIAVEDFQAMLMERCERQAPLEKLSITRSYAIEASAVQFMREIVVEVAWDGFQEGDEPEEEDVDNEFGESWDCQDDFF